MLPTFKRLSLTSAACILIGIPYPALADLDGHGPDAWRVDGIGPGEHLNARMGPGTHYPVIETFAHNERGLRQITCVPYLTMAHAATMTDAVRSQLPPRWCLMRAADLSKAGWVAARYLVEDSLEPTDSSATSTATTSDDMIAQAQDVVRALYQADAQVAEGGPHPLDPTHAHQYFSSDVVDALRTQPPQAHPLYGAQDFEGSVSDPIPDPDDPMFRGMITLHVHITNFGRRHTAIFRLRADPRQTGAPVRIFAIDHDDWTFP